MSNVYYQDELRYLRDVGPEFARLNPEIARTLGDRGSDPDVERLLPSSIDSDQFHPGTGPHRIDARSGCSAA